MKKLILITLFSFVVLPFSVVATDHEKAMKYYSLQGGDKVIAACLEKSDGSGECKKLVAAGIA